MIDEKQLAEWEALANAASPGPWTTNGKVVRQYSDETSKVIAYINSEDDHPWGDDALLVAAARTAVPELIAEVRRLRAEVPGKRFCQLPGCGGWIGPDVTGRPMCYQCGPRNMRRLGLHDVGEIRQAERERCAKFIQSSRIVFPDGYIDMPAEDLVDAIRALPEEP